MEKFFNSLPKPVLVILVLVAAIIFFMVANPPHTVCDTQVEALQESLQGTLFPIKSGKNMLPPNLSKAKEVCQLGNSAGSCYEYFSLLRKIAGEVAKSSSECTTKIFEVPEVQLALNNGIELMARIAWGNQPPEPGVSRFGWLQEGDLAVFCRLRGIYLRAFGEEGWTEKRLAVFAKLPGEAPPAGSDPSVITVEQKKATQVLTEQEIWNLSIFSVRCENYL
jgi:hypothetical protein